MKNLLIIFIIILIGSIYYLLTIRGTWDSSSSLDLNSIQATSPFESSHERATYVNALSIIYNHTSELSQQYANFASPDVGIYKGKFYSYFPPGISYFMIPFYQLGQPFNLAQVSSYSSISLLAVLNLFLIYKISVNTFKISKSLGIFVALIFGFASTNWSYSITIYQHSATVFLMLLAFYSAWRYRVEKRIGWVWAIIVWASYGLSVFVDYPNGILLSPVMIYFLISSLNIHEDQTEYKISLRLSLFATSIIFILLTALFIYYNSITFGNWKILTNLLPRYNTSTLQNTQTIDTTTLEQQNAKKPGFTLLSENLIINGLYEILFAPDKGLFFFSPIFIIGLLGVLISIKRYNFERSTLLAIIILNIIFYASFGDPYGGWSFGPRYIIPSIAALSIFVGLFLKEFTKLHVVTKLVTFLLFSISCAVSLLGALTTNTVPPKVEADYLHIKYSFFYNLDYLIGGQSDSFIYNTFFKQSINLLNFYLFILLSLITLSLIILFLLPVFEGKKLIKI